MRAILLSLLISFSIIPFSKAQNIQPFVVDTGVELNPRFIKFISDDIGFIGGYAIESFNSQGRPLVGQFGYLYRTTDRGNTWDVVWKSGSSTYANSEPLTVTKLNGGILGASFVDSNGVNFWYSFDSGETWTVNENEFTTDSVRMWVEELETVGNKALASSTTLGVKPGFAVLLSEDLGENWQTLYADESNSYYPHVIDFSNDGSVYFGYERNTWTQGPVGGSTVRTDVVIKLDLTTGGYDVLVNDLLVGILDLDMLTNDVGFVIGERGVYKTVNAGATWDKEQVPFSPDFIGDQIFYNESTQDVFVIGREGENYNSRDVVLYKGAANGLSWTEVFREYSDTNGIYENYKEQVFEILADGSILVGMFNNRFYRIDNVVGVEEADLSDQLQVYPNPASTNINITFSAITSATIELFDVTGQNVRTENVIGLERASIDVSNIPSGVYVLQVKYADGATITKKVVVQ